MSHHVATLQSAFDKTASVLDFAYTVADRLYWLDDNYVQPFYSWAAPRLRDVAISGLYWALVTLIDVSLWLIDTTRQFMARDAHAIALDAFVHAHAPLPKFPALCPAAVPLARPSMAMAPVFPSPVVPMALSQFLDPDHCVQRWLTSALPLVLAPGVTEALTVPVSPAVDPVLVEVTEAAPVLKKARQSTKATGTKKAADKTPRKRSPKTTAAAAL
jgi:hypothetical protein